VDATELELATDRTLLATRALVGVAARSLSAIEGDVTLSQYRALVLLGSRGDQNVGALAVALGIHASTATRLCDRLLAKGLIVRSTTPGNRREVTVALSEEGVALVRGVTNSRRREIREIVSRIDPAERQKLVAAFEAFTDAAGEIPDDGWKLGWER
jgi:DNA-binding MarR family transcriptional regulator